MTSDDRDTTAEELLAHSRWLKRLARILVRDPNVADDVVQQTWMAAAEHPPRKRGNLRAWLGRVLRRKHLDHLRGERRRTSREQVRAAGRPRSAPSPEELLERAETRARVAQAVVGLREPYRSTVLLRYFEEVPPRKIAALQGVPVSTVNTRLARGLNRLRERLRLEYGGDRSAWRIALLPVAGLSPITSSTLSLGSLLVSTTTTRVGLGLAGLLLFVGLAFLGGWFLLDGEEPATGIPPVDLSHVDPEDYDPGGPRLEGVAAPNAGATDGPSPPSTGTVLEGEPAAAGVVEGRVQDPEGRPIRQATVLLWRGRAVVRRTQSGAQGAFAFEQVPAGEYVLSVHGGAGARATHPTRPGGPVLLVTLEVGGGEVAPRSHCVTEGDALPSGVVGGVVLDDEERPFAPAAVMLWRGPSVFRRMRTEELGTFEFDGLDDDDYVVTIHARGWASIRHPVRPGAGHLRVVLERGPSVGGTVVDAQTGEPIANMRIEALGTEPGTPHVATETAEDGTFRVGGLAAGPTHLDVGSRYGNQPGVSSEYLFQRAGPFETGTLDLVIEATPGLVIAGEIRASDGTRWTTGASVRITAVSGEGTIDYGRQRHATVGAEGTFRIPGLEPGRYDVTVNPTNAAEGGVVAALTHVRGIAGGTPDLVVALATGIVLQGRLVDERGEPVVGKGWVWVSPEGTSAGAPGSVAARQLEGGGFETPPLDAGRAYHVRALGFVGHQDGEARGVHPGDSDIVLTLERGFQIEGQVELGPGRPVTASVPVVARATGAEAEAVGKEPWAYVRAVTDGKGQFVLGGLREGVAYAITAGGGSSGLIATGQAAVVEAPAKDVTLHVVRGVALSGRLVDATGAGVRGVVMHARPLEGGRMAYTRTDPDGRFAFAGVPPGRVVLAATVGDEHVNLGAFEAPAEDLRLEVP